MCVGHYEIKPLVYEEFVEGKKKWYMYYQQAKKVTLVFILSFSSITNWLHFEILILISKILELHYNQKVVILIGIT